MNDYIEAMLKSANEARAKNCPKTADEIIYRLENELDADGFAKKGFGYYNKKDIMTRAQRLIKAGWSKSDALTLANILISDLAIKMGAMEKRTSLKTGRF